MNPTSTKRGKRFMFRTHRIDRGELIIEIVDFATDARLFLPLVEMRDALACGCLACGEALRRKLVAAGLPNDLRLPHCTLNTIEAEGV